MINGYHIFRVGINFKNYRIAYIKIIRIIDFFLQ